MATIQVEVEVLDEKCADCKIMKLCEDVLYVDGIEYIKNRYCERLETCRIIEEQRRKEK